MGELALQIGTILKFSGLLLSPFLLLPLIVLIIGKPIAKIGDTFIDLLDPVSSAAMALAMVATLVMLFAQLMVIIGRYSFGWSASWLNEMVVYGFAAMFMLAAASALKADAHVRVDIFRAAMTPRYKSLVDLLGLYLLLFPVCILILWTVAGSSAFAESWISFQGSRESDGLPIYYLFRTLIPVFAVLMILQGLSEALKSAMILRGLREPPQTSDFENRAA